VLKRGEMPWFVVPAVAAGMIAAPIIAQDTDWRFVIALSLKEKSYHAQIDAASIRREGRRVTYWVRLVEGAPDMADNPFMRFDQAAYGPSLYQNDCATGQSRLMQGQILWGYEGGGIPLNRPAPWEYVVPDSVASAVHRNVCAK
jgi:hypothetical protein